MKAPTTITGGIVLFIVLANAAAPTFSIRAWSRSVTFPGSTTPRCGGTLLGESTQADGSAYCHDTPLPGAKCYTITTTNFPEDSFCSVDTFNSPKTCRDASPEISDGAFTFEGNISRREPSYIVRRGPETAYIVNCFL